jgi:hypothetical protein
VEGEVNEAEKSVECCCDEGEAKEELRLLFREENGEEGAGEENSEGKEEVDKEVEVVGEVITRERPRIDMEGEGEVGRAEYWARRAEAC